ILDLSWTNGGRAVSVEVLRGLALDEDGVSPEAEDRLHGEHVRPDDVLQCGHEGSVALKLLVPPAVPGRKPRADEHFVDWRVELDPAIPAGERFGIRGEEPRKVRVLEIADPIGDAEVAEIGDRRDIAPPQVGESGVRERPVTSVRSEVGAMK